MVPIHAPEDDKDIVPSPYRLGAPVCTGDNDDNNVTPVAGVDVFVKNFDNAKKGSTSRDDDVPIVAFDGNKYGDVTAGDADEVYHAKGTKIGVQVGVGVGIQGGGGV